jgi:hypothetical protein
MHRAWIAILSAAAGVLTACSDCPRDACEASSRPYHGSLVEGVAGVVSSESDTVANGCQRCEWGSARLDIWSTAALVANAAEAEQVVSSGPPVATVMAEHRYEKALGAGNYLVCVLPGACASFALGPREIASVNVRTGNGPSGLVVFPAGRGSRAPSVFPVRTPAPWISIQVDGLGYFAGERPAELAVLEPTTEPGGLRIQFSGVQGARGLTFSVAQGESWPPRASFDIGFSRDNPNQIGESGGGSLAVSRAGHLDLVVSSDGRFSGSFDAVMEEVAPGATLGEGGTHPLRGTLSGTWILDCSIATGGGGWRQDPGLRSAFCIDVARRAGLRP